METQKIVHLVNGSDNEYAQFATKKWYVIDSESKENYSHTDPIKVSTKSIESSLCDYSDAYVLVTGNIAVTRTIAAPAGSPAGTEPQKSLKIVHHLKNVLQKLMVLLLMKQILLIIQCLCTT